MRDLIGHLRNRSKTENFVDAVGALVRCKLLAKPFHNSGVNVGAITSFRRMQTRLTFSDVPIRYGQVNCIVYIQLQPTSSICFKIMLLELHVLVYVYCL